MQGMRTKALVAVAGAALMGSVVGGAAVYAATQTFTDVPPTNPFYDEIEWGAANGIVNGYPDGTFKPGADVTRQASVAFLGRYNDAIELQQQVVTPIDGTGGTRITQCPAGKRALSGGGRTTSPSLLMTMSHPVLANGQPADDPALATGWRVAWRTDDLAVMVGSANATLWVLCAPPYTTG